MSETKEATTAKTTAAATATTAEEPIKTRDVSSTQVDPQPLPEPTVSESKDEANDLEKDDDISSSAAKRAREEEEKVEEEEEVELKRTKSEKKEKEDNVDDDDKEKKKDKENKEETKKEKEEQPKKKFVFGATTPFGANAFSFNMSKNVFGSLPSTTTSTKEFAPAATTTTATTTESIESTESKPKSASVFGARTSFGNAFQSAISKKSIFDSIPVTADTLTPTSATNGVPQEPATKTTDVAAAEPKSTAASNPLYKQVTLAETQISTGEENEMQTFTCRAKLYTLNLEDIKSGWKERGVGTLHVNKSKDLGKIPNRVIMRSNGLLNVILNVKISRVMKLEKGFGGSLSPEKFIRFGGVEEGKVVQFAVKVGKVDVRDELFERVEELIVDEA